MFGMNLGASAQTSPRDLKGGKRMIQHLWNVQKVFLVLPYGSKYSQKLYRHVFQVLFVSNQVSP